MRRVPAEKRAECVRLRLEEDLSTPVIARRVGVCHQSVYKILADARLPWTGKAAYRRVWTAEMEVTLCSLYPEASKDEVLAAFPGQTWLAVARHASYLKLKRVWVARGGYAHGKRPSPLCARLRMIREARGLTRTRLSPIIGYHVNQILAWETGRATPRLDHVLDWCAGLGYSLELARTNPLAATSVASAPLAAPDRARMMAGR